MDELFSGLFCVKASVRFKKEQKTGHVVKASAHQGYYCHVFEIINRRVLWKTELLTIHQKILPLFNNLNSKKFPDIEYLSTLSLLFVP